MNRKQLIKKYIEFFSSKNHKEIPNVSLIPENDPTVLFTTAGMHPLVPYLLGEKHPLGKRLVGVQRCIRTQDIDDVGDSYHHTFFEMLGNWSLGDYWKKEAIEFSFEFLTKTLKIPVEKLAVSCFKGDKDFPRDNESANIWEHLGFSEKRIVFLGKKENWWGPAGKTGPCGPDTEMFYYKEEKVPERFNIEDKNWIEIWNDVLMEYEKIEIDTILVDAINVLIHREKGLNKELAEFLKNINKKIIIVTNATEDEIKQYVKGYDFKIFTLNKNPDKTNQEYFKILIKKFNLDINKTIYFDHKKENIESAKKVGIISELYENHKQIEKFINDSLYCYKEAKQKNIDTGMGVERTIAVLNNLDDDYLSDCFFPIIKEIERLTNKKYKEDDEVTKSMRIIADHIKASVFIIADGIVPSNIEQGYVLRRLIRRAVRHGRKLGLKNFIGKIAEPVFDIYSDYSILKPQKSSIFGSRKSTDFHGNKKRILEELEKEEKKFLETLEKGISIFDKITKNKKIISGKDAFLLYQSYGFPLEIIEELSKEKEIKVDKKGFILENEKHQKLSRTATEGKFKSGLADKSRETIKLHTATHLLNEALCRVLGKDIMQKGSNITAERLRFDFNFNRKLSNEEIKKVENLVNEKIKENLEVKRDEMSVEDAKKLGAKGVFESKYGDKVYVYSITKNGKPFSIEICSGPHVKKTGELGKFRIKKEESISAGVRRIKGELLQSDK